jgi:hypothetical protein
MIAFTFFSLPPPFLFELFIHSFSSITTTTAAAAAATTTTDITNMGSFL